MKEAHLNPVIPIRVTISSHKYFLFDIARINTAIHLYAKEIHVVQSLHQFILQVLCQKVYKCSTCQLIPISLTYIHPCLCCNSQSGFILLKAIPSLTMKYATLNNFLIFSSVPFLKLKSALVTRTYSQTLVDCYFFSNLIENSCIDEPVTCDSLNLKFKGLLNHQKRLR